MNKKLSIYPQLEPYFWVFLFVLFFFWLFNLIWVFETFYLTLHSNSILLVNAHILSWKQKSNLFLWTVVLWKVLKVDSLIKWKKVMVDWCCMHKCSRETVDHLLPHYPVDLMHRIFLGDYYLEFVNLFFSCTLVLSRCQ